MGRNSLDRIAVLSSGGLDSSVLLVEEAKTAEVYPIYVRCGLAWEEMEREALEVFLRVLNSPRIKPVTTLVGADRDDVRRPLERLQRLGAGSGGV